MKNSEILFEEKQYLGHNRFSIVIRTLLTLFCFFGYYWSENPEPVQVSFFRIGNYPIKDFSNSGLIFFVAGVIMLVLSAALNFVLHIRTRVHKGILVLEGFWTSRRVNIQLSSIVAIRKGRYMKNNLGRAVYNLHNRGIIKFYTSGEEFIELTDVSGTLYRIGSQKAPEFFNILKKEIKN